MIEADPPRRIVEESVGAGGKRRTRGTYTLDQLPDGATRVSFELAWLEAPRLERLGAPLNGAFIKRANGKAMRRLARALAPPEAGKKRPPIADLIPEEADGRPFAQLFGGMPGRCASLRYRSIATASSSTRLHTPRSRRSCC